MPNADFLGGKLVASLITSREVAIRFEELYGNKAGLISSKSKKGSAESCYRHFCTGEVFDVQQAKA